MSFRRPVVIMEMPEELNAVEAQQFMQDMQPLLEDERPRIVFDCSQLRAVNRAGVDMILHCLEAAMNLDGNLKLAAISPEAKAVLELMGVAGVFQAFATTDDAVRSFPTDEGMSKRAASVDLYSSESLKKAS